MEKRLDLQCRNNMKRTKIIPVKWIPDGHDSDWDGVPNYRDCDIFNPYKQDFLSKKKEKQLQQAIKEHERKQKKKEKKMDEMNIMMESFMENN